MYFGACGLEVERKLELLKRQTISKLQDMGYYNKMDILSFELYGRPETNARNQAAATSLYDALGRPAEQFKLMCKLQDSYYRAVDG